MPNYCMQRNGAIPYLHAYFALPSADADDVRRFLGSSIQTAQLQMLTIAVGLASMTA
jgi:hypothetical protein